MKMSGKTAKSAFLILTAAALSFTAAVGGCKCVSADAEYHTAAEENTAYGFNTVNFENREYAIESVETASGGELDYDTFYGGTVIGAVKYKNSVSPITVAAAVYDYSGNMLDVRAETFKPRADVYGSEKFVFEKGLYIPSDKGECYVKVFVFDSAEKLTPLAECKKITVTPPEKTLHIDDDVGGFAFFISGQYNTEINKYNYVSFEKNGNICDVPIYDDYKSIGKKSSVQMKKIKNSAVFTDVSTHKKALYSSEKKYNYYLVSGYNRNNHLLPYRREWCDWFYKHSLSEIPLLDNNHARKHSRLIRRKRSTTKSNWRPSSKQQCSAHYGWFSPHRYLGYNQSTRNNEPPATHLKY